LHGRNHSSPQGPGTHRSAFPLRTRKPLHAV